MQNIILHQSHHGNEHDDKNMLTVANIRMKKKIWKSKKADCIRYHLY